MDILSQIIVDNLLSVILLVVALATVGITVVNLPIYGDVLNSLRYAFFQVSSIVSTTGFATADYVLWPQVAQFILILLMFMGACAGSTGGGIKCSRALLLLRCIRREIRQIIHPRSVYVVKLDGRTVEEDTLRSVLLFFATYMFITMGAALVVAARGAEGDSRVTGLAHIRRGYADLARDLRALGADIREVPG